MKADEISVEKTAQNQVSRRRRSENFARRKRTVQEKPKLWKSIVTNGGSVQHLDFLDEVTKDVFKTAVEIDQRWLIDFAADRQQYICQSQSLNVFFPANVSKQELHAIHMMAWKKKVKTLYYLRSEAYKRAENVSDEALRQYIFESIDEGACLACEG